MENTGTNKGRAKFYLVLLVIALAAASFALIYLSGKKAADADSSGTDMKTIILYGNDDPADQNILKNRLNVFAGKGNFSLTEENGCLKLCLPFSKALTSSRIELLLEQFLIEPGPRYAACASPGVNSYIESHYTVAAVTPEDIIGIDKTDISIDGNHLPTDEVLQVPVLKAGDAPLHSFCLKLKDSASFPLRRVLERGDNLYLENLSIYEDNITDRFKQEGWQLQGHPDDTDTFYIEYSDSDELCGNEKILEYNLTHESLSKPYNYCFLEEVEWADPDKSISHGVFQRSVNEIGDTWYFFQTVSSSALSADERTNVELLLCRRLDLLESPYAIGNTQQGDICVRIKSGRINERIINLLTGLDDRYRYYLKIPDTGYSLSPEYSKIQYDTGTSSFIVTLSDEDLGELEDKVKGCSEKAPIDLFLCTDDGPIARTSFSLPTKDNELSFHDTVFNRENGKNEDCSWFAALLGSNPDTDFSFKHLGIVYYYRHETGTDIFNDPHSFPLKEKKIVSVEEIEKKIRQLLPKAEVGLSHDSYTLNIHMNLEHSENLPDRIYEYTPRLLEICSLKDSYYSNVRIYPCEYKGDERAWLVFGKHTKEGKTDISFNGYFYNGRMDAYADRILELEKTNSFFRDMIIDPRFNGWELRDF